MGASRHSTGLPSGSVVRGRACSPTSGSPVTVRAVQFLGRCHDSRLVAVEPGAELVGAVCSQHVAVGRAACGRGRGVAGDRLEEVDLDAGDARLVVLGHRLGRVDLVAGRAVADGADDAAVVTGGIGLDAPVEAAGEADDRQVADVHARAEHGRRRGLVVRLIRDAGRLPAVGVGLEHVELVERVGLVEVVVAGEVGQSRSASPDPRSSCCAS